MGSYESAEAAYWAFFTTYNDRSPSGRAGVMSYPHVRVAAGRDEPVVTNTAAEYEQLDNWSTVEQQGWAYTQPITPRVVHRSPDKVHFAGGWTRFRADGSEISRNRLLYIASELEDGWGIQGAFGVDGHLLGEDAEPAADAALVALEREMANLETGRAEAWLDCFHYPTVIVFAPGQIEYYETREATAAAYRDWTSEARPVTCDARVTAVGPSGVLIEQDVTSAGEFFQQVSLFVERDGVWASAAVSAVRPDM